MPSLALVVAIVTLLIFVVLGARSERRLVMVVVFLAPWELSADVGLTVSAFRLGILALVAVSFINACIWSRRHRLYVVRPSRSIMAFIIYSIMVTTLSLFLIGANTQVHGGELRQGEARTLSQIVMFLLMVVPLWVVPGVISHRDEAKCLLSVYIYSVAILVALGWIQLAYWQFTGSNPMPIGVVNAILGGENLREAVNASTSVAGFTFNRMNSLAGEPKRMGMVCAFALAMLQVKFTAHTSFGRPRRAGVLWVLIASGLVASLSTAGFYLWVILSVTIIGGGIVLGSGFKAIQATAVTTLIVVVLGVAGVSVATGNSVWPQWGSARISAEVGAARTIDRTAGDSHLLEGFDQAILAWLTNEPMYIMTGVGRGNAHIFAESYLPPFTARKHSGYAFGAKTGILLIVSETGMIGIVLLSVAIAAVIRDLWHRLRSSLLCPECFGSRAFGKEVILLLLISFVAYLARGGYVQNEFFLFLALTLLFVKKRHGAVHTFRSYATNHGLRRACCFGVR